MRVIAGKARRTNLVTPEGKNTRPTSDRIKETLFNMLQQELYDVRFLDIFSGSGGISIEALSRGAKEAVMIDNDAAAIRCIKENIKRTHFEDSRGEHLILYLWIHRIITIRKQRFLIFCLTQDLCMKILL